MFVISRKLHHYLPTDKSEYVLFMPSFATSNQPEKGKVKNERSAACMHVIILDFVNEMCFFLFRMKYVFQALIYIHAHIFITCMIELKFLGFIMNFFALNHITSQMMK